jgi:hypothetical protein
MIQPRLLYTPTGNDMPKTSTRIKKEKIIGATFVCVVAWAYAQWTWKTTLRAEEIALSLEPKPFVFRALVPWLARGLMELGMKAETALSLLIVLSALGLWYGIEYLSNSF